MSDSIYRCAKAVKEIDNYLLNHQKGSSYIKWLDRYSKRPNEHEDSFLFGMLVQAMFSGGMKGQTVDRWMPRMENAFHNWDIKLIASMSDIELEHIIESGQVIKNRPKLNAIVSNAITVNHLAQRHKSFGNYLSSFNNLRDISVNLIKRFDYLGEVTAEDFLRNVGFDTLKPDRHLTRWLNRMQAIDTKASVEQVFEVYSGVAKKTSLNRYRIDAAIYLFCADRDDVIDGGICGNIPLCHKCPITSLCPKASIGKVVSSPIRHATQKIQNQKRNSMNAHEEGKKIYQDKVLTITLNRMEWREGGEAPGKGDHFRKIMNYNGGKLIPYSFFTEAKSACEELFDSTNVRNYIYFVIKFALELGKLKETPEGLKCIG